MIVLPVTTGLLGSYIGSGHVVALYGINLTLISVLNTVLWIIAAAPRRDWVVTVAPVFAAVIFLAASVLGLLDPHLSRYLWPIAFLAPIVAASTERRQARR